VPKSSSRKHDTRRANRDRRQRIEELRKQQRASERRKNFMYAGAGIIVAIGLILAAVIPAYYHDKHQKQKAKQATKVLQLKPTAAETSAGCTGVHQDPVSPAAQHVTSAIDYTKSKYGDTEGGTAAIPPSGGEHNPISLGDSVRFYPLSEKPRAERAVHNLEHGYIVIWYDSKLPKLEVTKLQTMAQNPALSRLLVVGWYPGDLPDNKHVVLTSWGRTERCGTVSQSVVNKFYADHLNSNLSPEAGLPPISGADSIPPGQLPNAQASTSPAPSEASSTPSPSASSSP
jgi:hypothetical protein